MLIDKELGWPYLGKKKNPPLLVLGMVSSIFLLATVTATASFDQVDPTRVWSLPGTSQTSGPWTHARDDGN